jgi:rRNA maturation endonuclease Nob1
MGNKRSKRIERTMKWITCPECEEDFRVITDSLNPVTYCPLCGSDLPEDELEDEFDDE